MNLAPVVRLQPGRSILLGINSFLEDFDYDLELVGDQCGSAFGRQEEGNLSQEGRGYRIRERGVSHDMGSGWRGSSKIVTEKVQESVELVAQNLLFVCT